MVIAAVQEKLRGRVATVIGRFQIAVNRGSRHGVHEGQRAALYIPELEVKDPDDGAMLGKVSGIKIGNGKVTTVTRSWCIFHINSYEEENRAPAVGDWVIFD